MKKVVLYIKMLFLGFSCFSCDNFLNEYSQTAAYIESVNDLDELLIGECFMGRAYGDNQKLNFLQVLADESQEAVTQYYGGPSTVTQKWKTMRGFFAWMQNPYTSYDGSLREDDAWPGFYGRISGANVILEDGQKFMGNSKTDDKLYRILGECYFLRAWNYFMLSNIYGLPYNTDNLNDGGGVPLKLNSKIEDTKFRWTNTSDVYAQVISDLKNAINYFQQGEEVTSKLHPSEAAAWALLSRVYLYMEKYDLSIQAADSVKGYGVYNFQNYKPGSGSAFLTTTCPEVIFVQGASGIEAIHEPTSSGALGSSRSEGTSYCVSSDLEVLFDIDNDLRYSAFFALSYFTSDRSGVAYAPGFLMCRKFRTTLENSFREWDPVTGERVESKVTGQDFNEIGSMRYAEVVLNKAESQACKGDLSGAHSTMSDFLITRYKVAPVLPTEQMALIEFIRQERNRELCFEGHRWFDLRRYAVNKVCKQQISITHKYHVMLAWNNLPIEGEYVLAPYNETTKGVWMLPLPAEIIDYCYPSMESFDRTNGVTTNVY